MRIINLVTIACIASLPHAASWSWGVKSSDDEEGVKEDDNKPSTSDADASLEATTHDDDPLISKFPDLITWFRNGGGISKFFLQHCNNINALPHDIEYDNVSY